MSTTRLLDPKLDLVFKRLFAGAPDLLIDLVNAVRSHEPPIESLEVLNPEITPEDISKKLIVLDILARDVTGRVFDVEMQMHPHVGLPARLVFYLARLLGQQLQAGEEYRKIRPVVGISLLNFTLFQVPDQAIWRFELRDHQHPEIVLDHRLQLNLIEMPKLEHLTSQDTPALAHWVTWFRHWHEETIMREIQHPAVQKAQQRLSVLSADEKAYLQAIQRERSLIMEAALGVEREVELMMRMLRVKFGEIPDSIEQKLYDATRSQFDRWAEQLMFADTLDQVFSQH